MKADGDSGEDRSAVVVAVAVERFFDMLEAGLHRDAATRQKRQLRGMAGETFQRRETVSCGKLANRVHAGVKIEGREAGTCLADLGDALRYLVPHLRERIGSHQRPSSI
jgi:hypothetical protein